MSYVQRVLLPGETIIHEGRLHWLIYGRAVVVFVIACILAEVSVLPQDEAAQHALLTAAAVAFALAILDAIAAALRRATTEFAVTDHRVIYKRGLLSRFTIEMSRDKVESVDVRQSLLGRVLNYGTILVRGTGGSLEPFRNVQDPLSLRSHITVG
jgi:uncharacterized membrane protein YdbT with pleckstrin-like domain